MLKFTNKSPDLTGAMPWKVIGDTRIFLLPQTSELSLFPASAGWYEPLYKEAPCVIAFNDIYQYRPDTQMAILLSSIGAIKLDYIGRHASEIDHTWLYVSCDDWAIHNYADPYALAEYLKKARSRSKAILRQDLFPDEKELVTDLVDLFTQRLEALGFKPDDK